MMAQDETTPLREPQHAPDGYAGDSNDSGYPVGRWEKRSADGELLGELTFDDGILHGTQRIYHEGGEVSHERHFENGVLTGTGREFHANGALAAEHCFECGHLHGICRGWRPDGKLKYTVHFQYGTKHGEEVIYAANGAVDSTTSYLFGIPKSNVYDLLTERLRGQFRFWTSCALLIILGAICFSGNSNALVMLLILESAILIHEAGHWLFARLAGIPMETFRIGIGPLIGSVRLGRTQLELAAIPILGYVRPFSLRPSEFSGFISRNASHPVDAREEPTSTADLVSRPRRAAFLVGGVTANFLLAWLLLWTSAPNLGPVEAAGKCGQIVFRLWAKAPQMLGEMLAIDMATKEDKGLLRALDDNDRSSRQTKTTDTRQARKKAASQNSPKGVRSRAGARVLSLVITVNLILAAFNLFPFPGLDGYHLAILAIEIAIRRPLPRTLTNSLGCVSGLFILMLILVGSFWFFRDIYYLVFG